MMRAARFDRFGSPEVLHMADVDEPQAGPGQVRVRALASGVSPVDAGLRSGNVPLAAMLTLPHIPGMDAAGVVDQVGDGVESTQLGDEVFGSIDLRALGGANAQFVVLAMWTGRPLELPWEQAGGAGNGIETATRALDRLGVVAGQTLFVHGATGGVGAIAVQLGVARGATVIGSCRSGNEDFVAGLGATPVVYGPGMAERITSSGRRRVDRAVDIAGAGDLPTLIALTGTADHVLTLADPSATQFGVATSRGAMAGEADGSHGLAVAAQLVRSGRFLLPIHARFGLADVGRAHRSLADGPRRGKTVLLHDD